MEEVFTVHHFHEIPHWLSDDQKAIRVNMS
jgi:hypothetical protein